MRRSGGARERGRVAGRVAESEGTEARVAPTMRRSVGQLSSSYAPMRHFAFENGLGVCLSVPFAGPAMRLDGNTPDQISPASQGGSADLV